MEKILITDLQLVLNQKDLDALTDKLKIALDNHLSWLSELSLAMVCENENLPSFCGCDKPYRQCKFGKWFYAIEDKNIRDHHDFIEIGLRHKELHQAVCKVVKSFKRDGKPKKSIYMDFKEAEDTFLSLFKNLLHKSLEANVNTDYLTRLPNRQALDVILKHVHGRIKRGQLYGCITLLDIDHFKNLNDKYGHVAGDKVLKDISSLLMNSIRDCDFVARYGGEEFMIYFPSERVDQAEKIAEKLRVIIEKTSFEFTDSVSGENQSATLTCSFGISPLDGNQPIKNSILNADEALYEAKEKGRNQVVVRNALVDIDC